MKRGMMKSRMMKRGMIKRGMMKRRMMKSRMIVFGIVGCLLSGIGLLMGQVLVVQASMPYDTYCYDWWGEDVLKPHAYLYSGAVTGKDMGIDLSDAQDIFVRDDVIYVADTGNSRIVSMTQAGEVLLVIDDFIAPKGQDGFVKPQGVFVTEDGNIYVADSGNGRIVEFTGAGEYVREIGRPQTELLASNQSYVPVKVVVDEAGRIYVSAYGINLGLVEFSSEGQFRGFMGAARVSISPFAYMWKNYFSTDAQKQRMETFIPTEYSNIYVDRKGFVYATISNLSKEDYSNGADAIRRLNPTGTDVLRRLGNSDIIGDLYTVSEDTKWSVFSDVAASDYGCYFVLDSAGGKVFCYDYDGNSLFIFGSKGTRAGMVQRPTAIELSSDQSRIFILDAQQGSILLFDITEYGRNLLGALKAHDVGDSQGAYELWKKVQQCDANSEIAYTGIGKTMLKEGNYRGAMEYFKLGNNRKYYTRAFQFYRKEWMQGSFGWGMGVVGLAAGMVILWRIFRKLRSWVEGVWKGVNEKYG